MKLIRYTDLNDWESLFGDPFRAFAPLLRSAANPARRAAASRALPTGVEWFEDDGHYHARLEVPGVKREQLRLDVEDGLVRLTHESGETSGEGETVRTSRYEQVLRCPEGIRSDAIQARLADGILQLSFPKEEVRKPVSITIN
jgi:HSP20 family protein